MAPADQFPLAFTQKSLEHFLARQLVQQSLRFFRILAFAAQEFARRAQPFQPLFVFRTELRFEFLALTLWESHQAIEAFAGANIDTAIVEPAARAVLSEFDDFARHYEVALKS